MEFNNDFGVIQISEIQYLSILNLNKSVENPYKAQCCPPLEECQIVCLLLVARFEGWSTLVRGEACRRKTDFLPTRL